jgi:DNA-binding response OmpR family regulator
MNVSEPEVHPCQRLARQKELAYVEQIWPSLSLWEARTLADAVNPPAQKAKILIVDDERPIVETLRYNLERIGHWVCAAYDGREAIAVAKRERPDVIVLDVMLPIIDGFSACGLIRSLMDVPIILLTAKGTERDKITGFQVGAADYVTKPFVLKELMERVLGYL